MDTDKQNAELRKLKNYLMRHAPRRKVTAENPRRSRAIQGWYEDYEDYHVHYYNGVILYAEKGIERYEETVKIIENIVLWVQERGHRQNPYYRWSGRDKSNLWRFCIFDSTGVQVTGNYRLLPSGSDMTKKLFEFMAQEPNRPPSRDSNVSAPWELGLAPKYLLGGTLLVLFCFSEIPHLSMEFSDWMNRHKKHVLIVIISTEGIELMFGPQSISKALEDIDSQLAAG